MNSEAVETSLCTTADRLERIEAALRLDFLDNHRQFQQSVDTGKEQQTGTSMSSSASTSSPPLTDQPPPFPLETLERLRRLQREWTELKERHEVVAAGKRVIRCDLCPNVDFLGLLIDARAPHYRTLRHGLDSRWSSATS